MSDPVLQAIYDAFPPSSEGRKALLRTRWKDGIDIDVPTSEAMALYAHAKEEGRKEGRKEGMREAAGICRSIGKTLDVDHSYYADEKGARMLHALHDTGCHRCADAILAALEGK